MAVPNYLHVVKSVAQANPTEWKTAHTGGPGTEDFIKILAKEINVLDAAIGLNGKRGDPNDLSDDALCFRGEGADHLVNPDGSTTPASVIDVIGGAGGPNPTPTWNVVSDPAKPIKTAWVDPFAAAEPPSTGTPFPSYGEMGDDAFWRDNIGKPLQADMAPRPLDDGSSVWFSRSMYRVLEAYLRNGDHRESEAIIRDVRNQWRAILGLPPI